MMAEAVKTSDRHSDEESFIILGTSPGTSLDIKYNGAEAGQSINEEHLEEALKDMSVEANLAFKAQFMLGDNPSPNSMMVASSIASEEKSTEEIQKKIGELVDENVLLKETLKQNNDSMKEQLLMIASCQEDVLNTHKANKDKFEETRELIEKLRQENKTLKEEISKHSVISSPQKSSDDAPDGEAGDVARTSHTSSVYEFVTSPDDDTINKLTAQLELVEKQRRQIIVENEKLTWQKESLEHIIDATTKERDDVKQKLLNLELQHSIKESERFEEKKRTDLRLRELEVKVKSFASFDSFSSDDLMKRNAIINELNIKMNVLQCELKTARLKVLEAESIKMEYGQGKSNANGTLKIYKEQVRDLQARLKEAQTAVFQPVRFSISSEAESGAEFSALIANVKLYDTTIKHLSELLNAIIHGTSEDIVKTMDLVVKVQEMKLDKGEKIMSAIEDIRQSMERQHSAALGNVAKIRATVSIFESIFMDYKELLKKNLGRVDKPASSNEVLTQALLARAAEVDALKNQVKLLKSKAGEGNDDYVDLLKAQIVVYKTDFEAERDAREKMASDKESAFVDLRNSQRRNQQLVEELEEIRRLNPSLLTTKPKPVLGPAPKIIVSSSSPVDGHSAESSGNMVCPKCMKFSNTDYSKMEDHFEFCFDDF